MTRRLLTWLSILLLLAMPFAIADDQDDNARGEREEKDDERKIELAVDDLKVTIKLERTLGAIEDAVKIEYDAAKAKLQVKHEEKNDSSDTEAEQKLEARFLALLEFVDENGNGRYDVNETIASAWALSGSEKDAKIPTNGTVDWGAISVTDVTSGNVSGKKLSSRASFGPNGTFGLDLFVYGDLTLVGNTSLEPTEAKIDIVIQHYPYVRNDSALAVIVDLKAKEEFEDDRESEDEDGISSEVEDGNLTFRLTFTWLENATVDGVDREVRSTVIKNKEESKGEEIEQKARVALAYPRGDLIVHDPTVGVEYGTQGSATSQVPAPALGAMLAVAAMVALAARRRHR